MIIWPTLARTSNDNEISVGKKGFLNRFVNGFADTDVMLERAADELDDMRDSRSSSSVRVPFPYVSNRKC